MEESVDFTNEISSFATRFLKEHFGESPGSLHVYNKPPFTLIHLKGFLMPSEKLLVEKNNASHVLETRDLLMNSLKPDFISEMESITGQKTMELYADWNLNKETGVLLAISREEASPTDFAWPPEVDAESVQEIIRLNSQRTQKLPDRIHYFWLTDALLIIERQGILIDIEKQLIANGVSEELRLAKRPLEHQVTKFFNLQSFLHRAIIELFVDWDFEADKGYMIILMKKDS